MTDIVLEGIALPGDLFWSDEFTAWKVGQSQRVSVTGALIVHESAKQAGRPITLQTTSSGNTYVAAVQLAALQALQALESSPRETPMTLTLPAHESGTRTFQVLFNRAGGSALEAKPIVFAVPYLGEDYFDITLRLIQV